MKKNGGWMTRTREFLFCVPIKKNATTTCVQDVWCDNPRWYDMMSAERLLETSTYFYTFIVKEKKRTTGGRRYKVSVL